MEKVQYSVHNSLQIELFLLERAVLQGLLREAVQIAKSISTNATLLKAPPIEVGSSDVGDETSKEKVKSGIEAFDVLLRKQLVPIMKELLKNSSKSPEVIGNILKLKNLNTSILMQRATTDQVIVFLVSMLLTLTESLEWTLHQGKPALVVDIVKELMNIVTELRTFAEKFPQSLKRSTITDRADELIQFVKERLIVTVKAVLKKEQSEKELEEFVEEFNNQCITFLESCVPCLEDFCERCESSCRFLFYCLQCKRLMCASCRTEIHSTGKWTKHNALGW